MKHQKAHVNFIAWRFYFLLIFILLIVAGLIARLVDLTIIKKNFLQYQGNARVLRSMTIPSFRGMIMDREGYPLAVSTAVYSVWVNPKEFSIKNPALHALNELLKLKKSDLLSLLKHFQNREFMYLKRDISPEIAEKVKKLKMDGVYLQQEYKRFYPEGEIASHIVGLTNIDDQGQEGVELTYNSWLSGTPGKKIVIKDRLGRTIGNVQEIKQQKPGNDLILSINHRIQYLAYRELLEGIKKNLATSGSAIVVDAKTGEILALVNQPSFNPNNSIAGNSDNLRNRAVTDVFEPGSTIKTFTIATALGSGRYKPDTKVDTEKGWMVVGGHIVKDEHSKGLMTVEKILQISSNVGATKIILSLPPNRLWNLLSQVGFGEETGINFPGERSGSLIKREWRPFSLATLSFGYGMSITAAQLARAYVTLANGGVKIPLSILKLDKAPKGKQVMDPKVAKEMLVLLESVVAKGGTGEGCNITGYHVAAKTGTTKMLGQFGYEKHHHISSFVGIAPVTNPRIVIVVVIHDPQGKHYLGGQVSGPVFKNIMEGTLRILNISPDDMNSLSKNYADAEKSAIQDQIQFPAK